MDTDKSFGEQNFSVDITAAIVQLLQKAVQNRNLQKEILWNQLKILQHLENGSLDKEKLEDDFRAALDGMEEAVAEDYYQIIARITTG